MLTLIESGYQLTRKKGCTVLMVCVSLLLCSCIAFYLGNIRSTEAALESLGDNIPVVIRLVNRLGDMQVGINIPPERVDRLMELPIRDLECNSVMAGAFSEEERAKELFTEGDVSIVGKPAFSEPELTPDDFTLMEGEELSFFEGDENKCIVEKEFAAENGIGIGDEVSFPMYMAYWRDSGCTYEPIGELSLQVIGTYDSSNVTLSVNTFKVPLAWMRRAVESSGHEFYYHYFAAKLADPMRLNSFKKSLLESGFIECYDASENLFVGDAVQIEDEVFIQTAEKLRQSLVDFQRFMVPFFLLVAGLSALSVFLIMRGTRREMAISCSLGRSKAAVAMSHFMAVLATNVAGLVLAFFVTVVFTGLSATDASIICLIYLACSVVGTVLALAILLWFSILELLIIKN